MSVSIPSHPGSKIVHVAIQASDPAATVALYRDVLGFKELITLEKEQLTATWLFDGYIYLSIVTYRGSSMEANAMPKTPLIHHLGFETPDPAACARSLVDAGCRRLNPEGTVPAKLLTPEGVMIEFLRNGAFYDQFLKNKLAEPEDRAVREPS